MDDLGGSGPSPLFLMRMMTGMVMPILIALVMIPIALYVIARWRANRDAERDPHLGLKFALSFFRWEGYQVALLAGAMLLYSMVGKDLGDGRGELTRTAFGFLVPGLLVLGAGTLALTRTNQHERPGVGRLLTGFNFMLTGVIAFGTLVMAFQSLFQKHGGGEEARLIWSLTVVYVSAWAVQGILYMRDLGIDGPAAAAGPTSMPQPGAPPAPPPAGTAG
jgi:hypothetical protein